MPDLGGELHDWRLERVLVGYLDVDLIHSALERCPYWTIKAAFQCGDTISHRLGSDVRLSIRRNICKLFAYPPSFMAGHDCYYKGNSVRLVCCRIYQLTLLI